MNLILKNTDLAMDPDTAKIITLGRILDEFRKMDLNMSIPQIQAFLMVALDAGMGMTEISEMVALKASTASRYLLEMGPARQQGDGNMALVERKVDAQDTRRAKYELTAKGRRLVKNIVKAIEKGAAL